MGLFYLCEVAMVTGYCGVYFRSKKVVERIWLGARPCPERSNLRTPSPIHQDRNTTTILLPAFLERAAQSGYREGERSIMEFLDARRVRSTILLRRLELLRSLKRGEIKLRAARGEFE